VERLAREVRRRELEERRAGMSAPEIAWERALELAPAEEIEELERLESLSLTQEPRTVPMLETLQSMRALKERIMYRSAPKLAASYRVQRCLLLCALKGFEEKAIEAHEGGATAAHPGVRTRKRFEQQKRSAGTCRGAATGYPRPRSTGRTLSALAWSR
jgi:hypothetical protein